MKEVILCKYGEIILKGANRATFESSLVKELRRRASPLGIFKIYFRLGLTCLLRYIFPKYEIDFGKNIVKRVRNNFGWIVVTILIPWLINLL